MLIEKSTTLPVTRLSSFFILTAKNDKTSMRIKQWELVYTCKENLRK